MTARAVETAGMMFEADVVQYMRPHGERRDARVLLPLKYQTAYNELTDLGCTIAGEVLMTGQVSLTIEHDAGDFDIRVVPNGPEVQTALHEMLEAWDGKRFDKWLAAEEGGAGFD